MWGYIIILYFTREQMPDRIGNFLLDHERQSIDQLSNKWTSTRLFVYKHPNWLRENERLELTKEKNQKEEWVKYHLHGWSWPSIGFGRGPQILSSRSDKPIIQAFQALTCQLVSMQFSFDLGEPSSPKLVEGWRCNSFDLLEEFYLQVWMPFSR